MPGKSKGKPRHLRVYWDTSVILAWIKDETRKSPQMEGLYTVAEKIINNLMTMFTCVTAYGEIFEGDLTDDQRDKLRALFDRSNTDVVSIDGPVGRRIAEVRKFYKAQSKSDGKPEVCYADAEHLAAATVYKADEFHTFDRDDKGGCRGLLSLDPIHK